MLKRTLFSYLIRDAAYYPILTLTGPRQSGKTTLVKAAFPGYEYVSLEERTQGFLRQKIPADFRTCSPIFRPPLIGSRHPDDLF